MKKILLLLLAGLFISTTIFAQEEDEDISGYLDLFTSGEFEDVNLGEAFDAETLATFDDEDTQAEIIASMNDAGLDAATQADTLLLMNAIAEDPDGNITLAEAAVSAGVDLDNLNDGIAVLIADEVSDQLFTGDQKEEMKDVFKTLANGLNMLSEFGQANAQSSSSSSLFGYQGYKLFAFTFGTSISVAADSETMSSVDTLLNNDEGVVSALEEKLEDGGFAAGFAMQGFTASFGINLSFLIDKLYAGAVFGSMNVNVSSEDGLTSDLLGISAFNDPSFDIGVEGIDLSLSTSTFGLTANYQIVKPWGIPILARWNGVSLGTGFIVNTFNVTANIDQLTTLLSDDEDDESTPDVDLGARFSIDSTSFTIPLEASTGVQLLSALTVTAGAGMDLKFGSSTVDFDITSDNPDSLLTKVVERILDQALEESETGIDFPYSSDGEIKIFNPRLMAGVGVGVGPAAIDLSATWYIRSGLNLGVNFVLRI